jgi:hypothetical protein
MNAWLIETADPVGTILYFCAVGDFCSNPNHAHKFASQTDAETVLAQMFNPENFRVAEHEWPKIDDCVSARGYLNKAEAALRSLVASKPEQTDDTATTLFVGLQRHFPNLGQLLNQLETEWKAAGCWSEWDEEVLAEQRRLHAAVQSMVAS